MEKLVVKYINTLKKNNKLRPGNELQIRKFAGELYNKLRNDGDNKPHIHNFVWFIYYFINKTHFDKEETENFKKAARSCDFMLAANEKKVISSAFSSFFSSARLELTR